ncbi:MAG: ATPase, partial [Treponema sp.]
MNRKLLGAGVFLFVCSAGLLFSQETAATASSTIAGIKYLAAALAVGIACIAGGMA